MAEAERARRGRTSRRKGAEGEREFAEAMGGSRVPLSGAMGGANSNDVVLPNGLRAEVKRRKSGFKELYEWVLDEREHPDLVAVRVDRKPWLVIQTLEQWREGRDLRSLPQILRALADRLEGTEGSS